MSRPVVLAGQRILPVPDALAGLFPEGGLRRGSTVSLSAGAGPGTTSLALALTVSVTRSGSWIAAVGLPSLGLVAAAQLGAALDRVAFVPSAGEQWPVVAAALLESVDILLLAPGGRVRPADARRLTARARERGAVLVILPSAGMRGTRWPETADVQLTVDAARWEGLGVGAGHLQSRVLDVVVTGRRAAGRSRRGEIWLPGRDGRIAVVPRRVASRAGADVLRADPYPYPARAAAGDVGAGPGVTPTVAIPMPEVAAVPMAAG